MNTKTSQLTAARTELQTHLANVERTLVAAHTAQTIRTARDSTDTQLTVKIERLEEQQRALRGILELICNRLGELEPAGSLAKPG